MERKKKERGLLSDKGQEGALELLTGLKPNLDVGTNGGMGNGGLIAGE